MIYTHRSFCPDENPSMTSKHISSFFYEKALYGKILHAPSLPYYHSLTLKMIKVFFNMMFKSFSKKKKSSSQKEVEFRTHGTSKPMATTYPLDMIINIHKNKSSQ